ncbi:DUF3006 domain-containing protein [Bacillus sp. C1-1]|nr:DUF3006 domain-containing protein [Bacillus sp. C1-1]
MLVSDSKYHGVVDRVTNGIAVILVDSLQKQFEMRQQDLPIDAKEGTWLSLTLDNSHAHVLNATVDHTQQKKKQQTIREKLNQVREQSSKNSKRKRKH